MHILRKLISGANVYINVFFNSTRTSLILIDYYKDLIIHPLLRASQGFSANSWFHSSQLFSPRAESQMDQKDLGRAAAVNKLYTYQNTISFSATQARENEPF
jgi:hypothetical protein